METARPWWRKLVSGVFGGAGWIVWGRGWLVVGEILVGRAGTDAVTLVGAAVPS